MELPTKKFMIEYQPEGKTIFKLVFMITNTKRVKAATPDEAKEMLYAIMNFENRLADMKRQLMAQAQI